jgi:hypothetical protein
VFFSVRVTEADRALFQRLGALGVIPKPFDPLKLPPQLQELWKKHHAHGGSGNDRNPG